MNFSFGIVLGILLAFLAFQYKVIELNKSKQYTLILDTNSTSLSLNCESLEANLLPQPLDVSQYEKIVAYFQSTNVGIEVQEKHPITGAKLWRQWVTAQPTTFRFEFNVYTGSLQFLMKLVDEKKCKSTNFDATKDKVKSDYSIQVFAK